MTQFRSGVAAILLACLSVGLLVGCPTQHLRDAQDRFSSAARAENARTLDDPEAPLLNDLLLSNAQAVAEYRLACDEAARAVAKNASPSTDQEKLERGTARMIQLFSLWRIAALSDDLMSAPSGGAPGDCASGGIGGVNLLAAAIDQERAAGMIRLGERERVMLMAIPALLEHQLGLNQQTDWPLARERLCEAVSGLDKAAADAAGDHPVRAYLFLAQIRTLDVWVDKLALNNPGDEQFNRRTAEVRPLIRLPVCGILAWQEEVGADSEQALRVEATASELTARTALGSYRTIAKSCSKPRPEIPVCTCSADNPACQ